VPLVVLVPKEERVSLEILDFRVQLALLGSKVNLE